MRDVSSRAPLQKSTHLPVLLATKMAERRLSDTAAAREIGTSQPTVTRWRHGRSFPNEMHVPALARFLGISQTKVRAAIDAMGRPATRNTTRPGTFGALLRQLENERNLSAPDSFARYRIDKSRYYRFRNDLAAPHATDIPALAIALGVPEETIVLAAYRTELWRAEQG